MRIVVVLLFLAVVSLSAADLPSPQPDRMVLTWHGDPATSMSVTWRTDNSVARALGQIAVSEDGPGFAEAARIVNAISNAFQAGDLTCNMHTVRFTGLQPDTLYAYRVGDGSRWSEWNQFRTASDREAPLTFIYSADAQNDIFSHWSRVIRRGFIEAPKANFIIHAGDLVGRGDRDDHWSQWFRAAGWINATVPNLPSPGNHEYVSSGGSRYLAAHWRAQFDLPENGVSGLEESNYYVDVHGVRVVSMNSNERLDEQARWLDELLSKNPNKWTVLTFHHPVFSSARGRDNKRLRELWQPIFDKYGVDLVLTGHDHTYARSNVRTGVNVRSAKSGTVYVVSVAGPKMYRVEREDWMRRAGEDTQLIQVVRIDGNKLIFQALTPTGRVYDAFELHKRDGQPNQLIERVPDSPERLRKTAPAPVVTGGN